MFGISADGAGGLILRRVENLVIARRIQTGIWFLVPFSVVRGLDVFCIIVSSEMFVIRLQQALGGA